MAQEHNAWNPGLIPRGTPLEYLKFETLYQPGSVSTPFKDVTDDAAFTGMRREELVAFTPARLVVHELLIRVTSSIVISEGTEYQDFGINFRAVAGKILNDYIQPHIAGIESAFDSFKARVRQHVERELANASVKPTPQNPARRGWLPGIFGRSVRAESPAPESAYDKGMRIMGALEKKAAQESDPLSRSIELELARIVRGVVNMQGYVPNDPDMIVRIATNRICNVYGSDLIGQAIEPYIDEAIKKEGYKRLQSKNRPIVVSVKGASAAGKSTSRPHIRSSYRHVLGIDWDNVMIISPDIYRKFFLDPNNLEDGAKKYFGRLTAEELMIVDAKMDRFLSRQMEKTNKLPDMVIDRFRFDTFLNESGSGPYVKKSSQLHMFFIITPPEATVERGWLRALETGRYKSVEDYLAHCVEAYKGMPNVFFKYKNSGGPRFHYEFLDNSVPKGTTPKVIAYGDFEQMTIADISALVNISRYTRINTSAQSPAEIYPGNGMMEAANNLDFLVRCIREIPGIEFVDEETDIAYADLYEGVWHIHNAEVLAKKRQDKDCDAFFAEAFKMYRAVIGPAAALPENRL